MITEIMRLNFATGIILKADTVCLLTAKEVSDILNRAQAGEFDGEIAKQETANVPDASNEPMPEVK